MRHQEWSSTDRPATSTVSRHHDPTGQTGSSRQSHAKDNVCGSTVPLVSSPLSRHETSSCGDSTGLPGSAQQSRARDDRCGSTDSPASTSSSRHGASKTTDHSKSPSNDTPEKHTVTVSQRTPSPDPAEDGQAQMAGPAGGTVPTQVDEPTWRGPAGSAGLACLDELTQHVPALHAIPAGVAGPSQPYSAFPADYERPSQTYYPARLDKARRMEAAQAHHVPAQAVDPAGASVGLTGHKNIEPIEALFHDLTLNNG